MKTAFLIFLVVSPIWALPNQARIIGGQLARAGEFPFAAAITKHTPDGIFFCTGSILTNEYVLTAGQCVDGGILFEILIGTHLRNGDDSTAQKVSTDAYILHPDYRPAPLQHDIGLIKFRLPITFTDYIKKLDLPYEGLVNYAGGVAFGWGQTSDTEPDLAESINYVALTALSDAECKLVYGNQVTENMVCFSGNYNEGICWGDSGSPLLRYVAINYIVVIAIASFFSGNGCETIEPSGYTAVFPYNDWIRNVTGAP